MKKKFSILIVALVLIAVCALIGCATTQDNASEKVPGAPALQPANHEGRSERGGSNLCYGCHGAGSLANPNLTYASKIPEDHYKDQSYETKEIDPDREQCITCHPVAEKG